MTGSLLKVASLEKLQNLIITHNESFYIRLRRVFESKAIRNRKVRKVRERSLKTIKSNKRRISYRFSNILMPVHKGKPRKYISENLMILWRLKGQNRVRKRHRCGQGSKSKKTAANFVKGLSRTQKHPDCTKLWPRLVSSAWKLIRRMTGYIYYSQNSFSESYYSTEDSNLLCENSITERGRKSENTHSRIK